jgi:hypothetical protein
MRQRLLLLQKKSDVWSAGDSIVLGLTEDLSDPTRRIDERLTSLFPYNIQQRNTVPNPPLSQIRTWTREAFQNSHILMLKRLCATFLSGNQASFNTTVRKSLPLVGKSCGSHYAIIRSIRYVNFFMITRVFFKILGANGATDGMFDGGTPRRFACNGVLYTTAYGNCRVQVFR